MSLFSASDFCNRSQIASEFLDRDSSFGASDLFRVSLLKIIGTRNGILTSVRDGHKTIRRSPAAWYAAHAFEQRTRARLPRRVLAVEAQYATSRVDDCHHFLSIEGKVSYTPVVFKKKLR